MSLALGKVLYESGDKLDYVYFPTTAIVSLLYIMENGATAEIGVVGNDGILSIALFMGGDTTPNRAVIQVQAMHFKMSAREQRLNLPWAARLQSAASLYTGINNADLKPPLRNRLHTGRTAALPLAAAQP